MFGASDGVISTYINSEWPLASLIFKDYGICPNAGEKCNEGGIKEDDIASAKLTAVQAGYLGISNCLRCKFFITGPAFIGGLKMLADEIARESIVYRERMHDFREQEDLLDIEEYECSRQGIPFNSGGKLIR